KLMHNMYPMIGRGLSAAIYTQTTDVEGEVNGLITYDRKKVKIDPELLRILHAPLFAKPVKSTAVFYDSEINSQNILLTAKNPVAAGWNKLDKSSFKAQKGPVMLNKGDNRWAIK